MSTSVGRGAYSATREADPEVRQPARCLTDADRMAAISAGRRNKLNSDDFALSGRRYPIQDAAHARAALQRVAQFGTATEKATVKRRVRAKFPSIAVDGQKKR